MFQRQQHDDVEPVKLANRFVSMVVPSALGLFVSVLMHTMNLVFIGHLNDPTKLAAVGMGNMIINMCGVAPFYGLNSALETLVSQAWGAGNKRLCGEYLQRGRIVCLIAFVPMILFFMVSAKLLRMVGGQDEKMIEYCHLYMLFATPAFLFYGLNDLQRKFLNQVGKQYIQMNSQFYGLLLHIALSYLFVIYLDLGVVGTALALFTSQSFIFVLNELKTKAEEDLAELNDVSIFDKNVYREFYEYFRIGAPNALTIMMEFASYEIMILFVGFQGVNQQATIIILLNLIAIPSMVAIAIQQAACAIVGQEIGANNVPRAKKSYSILFVLFIICDFLNWLILFTFRHYIVKIFTQSQEVAKMTNYVIWICLLTIVESFFKNSLLGVIKALEQQKRAMDVNVISYLCLVIPLAYFFAFKAQNYGYFVDEVDQNGQTNTNNRGVGLWIGYIVGIGYQCLGYLQIIASTDWQKMADGAHERQLKALKQDLEKYSDKAMMDSDERSTGGNSPQKMVDDADLYQYEQV